MNTKRSYRAKARAWYNSAAWKKRRAVQLAHEPLCWMCAEDGLAVAATVADHDPRHNGDFFQFFHGPLRSLCKRHHDSDKQKIENGWTRPPTTAEWLEGD